MFQVRLTTPWYPADSAYFNADTPFGDSDFRFGAGPWPVADFHECRSGIPVSDGRAASVKVSMDDVGLRTCQRDWGVAEFNVLLAVWWNGHFVHWGPLLEPEWDLTNGVVTLSSVDSTARMSNHYARIGDDLATSAGNAPFGRWVIPVGSWGLKKLRDTANNLPGFQEDHCPPLGIRDGVDTALTPVEAFTIQRGQETFSTMKDLVGHASGPELDFKPVWGVPGVYCDMDIHGKMGYTWNGSSFDPVKVWYEAPVFDFNQGSESLDGLVIRGGGRLITHAHVLSQNGNRRTVADADAAELNGIWVYWDATDYTTTKKNDSVLLERGKALISGYSQPLFSADASIKPDGPFAFIDNCYLGDPINLTGLYSDFSFNLTMRIVQAEIAQQGDTTTDKVSLQMQEDRDAGEASTVT